MSASELSPAQALRADLNGDGVVDHRDVRVFERRHGLSHELSNMIRETAERRQPEAVPLSPNTLQ